MLPATTPPATPPAPPARFAPAIYECDDCAVTHHGPDASIPVGWSITASVLRCPDCTARLSCRGDA